MSEKYSIMGDSISTFRGLIPDENKWYYDETDANATGVSSADDTWWHQVISADGGKLLSNASYSGAMVQGCGFPAGCSLERARQILGPSGETPDVVLVYMGINDYGWGSPEAQAAGGSEAASMDPLQASMLCQDPSAPAPADAVDRFREAYKQMLYNIRMVAPDAEVVCITLSPARVPGRKTAFCYALRGIELDDYNAAIAEVADAVGAKVADVRALGVDYDSKDGTHPTKEGMAQLASLVLASMGDSAAMESYPHGMGSVRKPQAGLHAGSPNAPVSASSWSCIVDA